MLCLCPVLSDGALSHMGSWWNLCSHATLFALSLWWIRAAVTSQLAQPLCSPQNKSPSELGCTNTDWCFSQCRGCGSMRHAPGGFSRTLSWQPLWLAVTCALFLAVPRGPVLLCWWWAWWCWLHAVRVPFCQSMKEKINFLTDSALEKQKGKIKSLKLYLFM